LSVMVLAACTPAYELPGTDLKIASVNLFIDNTDKNIEENLLLLDCDIYLLHEAVVGKNVDSTPFLDKGYDIYSHTSSSFDAFNGVLISRVPGDFKSVDLEYYYGFDPVVVAPFYSFDFTYNDKALSVIGAHVPPAVFMPQEIVELRKNAIEDICRGITKGRDAMGREVILAGDFNTHPSDKILDPILDSSLEDVILYSENRYDKTWKPDISPVKLARIDYFFISTNLHTRYLDSFSVAGSDHSGLITGIDLK